jgi:nitrite reductase/ring-hydroxylating ferredoxin subunit
MTASADAAGWTPVCPADELPPGSRREAVLPDGRIALVIALDDGYAAVCADCPHQDTPLLDAPVDGHVLTCPVHFWQWDLRTGEPLGIAELTLGRYEVKVEDGVVAVRAAP